MVEKTVKEPEIKPTVKTTEEGLKEESVKEVTTDVAVEKPVKKRKTTARKTTTKKPVAKKDEVETEVFVEFYGQQSSVEAAVKKVKETFLEEGHKESTIKQLKVYLKPEESAAYYVINEKFAGRVDLF